MTNAQIFAPDRTAVIFGAASGIGRATAAHCARAGMRLVLADHDAAGVEVAAKELDGEGYGVDVGDHAAMSALHARIVAAHDDIAFVMNNAGHGHGGGGAPFGDYDKWRRVFDTNFWGVVHGVQLFTPTLVAQARPSYIVNTGSKQGITNPPGDLAYNCTKAAVKTLTEGLAHALRNTEGAQVSAHLLIPGFTYTGLIARRIATKPDGAWTSEQVVDFMLAALDRDDFYILCPDNDVTRAMDEKRMAWHMGDIIENRPALSRWHPDYKDAFAAFMAKD